mmetsp:Transcript_108805/g.307671  ORF Transcript_108805/g.307671 Transcript_108805/m.307671 type:complete len:588 (-) Transcript_108805:12-1775(-)
MAATEDSADAEDAFASLNSVILTTSLLALIATGYRINTHRLRHLPESGAAMALGFVVGIAVRVLQLTEEEQLINFKGSFFFFVLLPPIIFDAGHSLETQMFVDNLGAILTFAVFGTIVSTWVTSYGLRWAAEAGAIGLEGTPLLGIHCHLFGALISATDPVATIALFGGARYRTDPLLHSLINGEAVLNDAVAIVLFSAISHHVGEAEPQLLSFAILGRFFLISAGSLLVGFIAGLVCSWCFSRSQLLKGFPDYEIAAILLAAYLTFALSQLFGLSGIVALFFFGVVLAQYNWYNLSERSKVASKVTFGTLAKLAESCVFIYLGVVAALSLGRFHWHLGLVFYSIIVIVVARAAHVFPFAALLNLGRERKIEHNMVVAMWFSGLRGAIAFALSLRIPCTQGGPIKHGTADCRNSDLLVTTTISIVVLTTLGVGTAMERVMTGLGAIEPMSSSGVDCQLTSLRSDDSLSEPLAGGVALGAAQEPTAGLQAAPAPPDRGGGPEPSLAGSMRSAWSSSRFSSRGQLYQAFARFDVSVLQPLFGGPCRQRAGTVEGEMEGVRLPSLQVLPRAFVPPSEEDAPAWSRSVIFE